MKATIIPKILIDEPHAYHAMPCYGYWVCKVYMINFWLNTFLFMQHLDATDWEDILFDIQEQRAVLLIGPEAMEIGKDHINTYIKSKIAERYKEDIAYYYERDGFFLFNSPEGKVRVARQIKRLYREIKPDELMLKKIVQIPFHLIVSLNPDTFISEAFYRYGIKHRFHYFQHRNRDNENDEIEKPTQSQPLVYNLFGSKDQDDSLILDYDDVYRLLQSAFGTSSLPNKFLRSFREASTYVFLGFQFDKWHSQLLLKFLSDSGRREKMISVDTNIDDKDTNEFIIRQFQVQFLGNQFDFLTELHNQCNQVSLLRKVFEDTDKSELIEIRQRVANGELTEALELLKTLCLGTPTENDITLLLGRYNILLEDRDKGIVDLRDYRLELNRILDTILELAQTFA